MEAVFELTDARGIHRESITVELGKRDPGDVRLVRGSHLEIRLPESTPASEWVGTVLAPQLDTWGFVELP